jgi:predicted transcriptional regulator
VLSPEQVELVAARARALGDPTRLRILESLSRGEQAVGRIALAIGTPQPAVSKHLQVLFHAGLVERRRRPASSSTHWPTPSWSRGSLPFGTAAQPPSAAVDVRMNLERASQQNTSARPPA